MYKYLRKKDDQIKIVEGLQNTPKLDNFDKKENHLVVWDDMVLAKDLSVVKKTKCIVYFHFAVLLSYSANDPKEL